ncbi:MAG: SDR family NAD(P)-dependent oxidoreductase [Acidimicrobiia bacterium]|nr:SDR family NAD(P)-dependent oxidoreductase [Acidimicrobiia bacterium]
MPNDHSPLAGRRVLITGAARGIGAALARRLHERGARVALAGLEPDLLAGVADSIDGPWWQCNVANRDQVDTVVDAAASALGGLDVVVANAGIAAQLPLVGGDPAIFENIVNVNLLGSYYTLRAAGRHVCHPNGYALAVSSMGAAVHLPLMGAYSASKAGVEALGDTLRQELRPTGARVGVAYFAELDTDMTSRGFDTSAARALLGNRNITRVTPLSVGIRALERGIARRSRIIVAPAWTRPALSGRMFVQLVADVAVRSRMAEAIKAAQEERVELTTVQPGRAE